MSNECRKVQARFLDFAEGLVRPSDAVAVRSHVARCPQCRQAWAQWQADELQLHGALGPVSPPRDIAGDVVAQLRAGPGRRAAPARCVARATPRWLLPAAAAGALLLVGLWALLGKRYEQVGEAAGVQGQVTARQRGARDLAPIQAGAPIYNGDQLLAGADSRLAVLLKDSSRLSLAEKTDVRLHAGAAQASYECGHELPHVCLTQGEVECELHGVRYFRAVGTPLGTAIVQGTRFRMKYVSDERVLLEVLEGMVVFSCPNGHIAVKPGSVWAIEGAQGIPMRVSRDAWK